jgi:hypothetical protein
MTHIFKKSQEKQYTFRGEVANHFIGKEKIPNLAPKIKNTALMKSGVSLISP